MTGRSAAANEHDGALVERIQNWIGMQGRGRWRAADRLLRAGTHNAASRHGSGQAGPPLTVVLSNLCYRMP